ncbi:MAG: acetyl-CoA carboxylase biotin carboxyl carrier protein subunit [Thaumarchaeota archaeon]|nr:acetyl-CoA carboxylase biotin carboxyl carrier protein subunit [Nitrososphaerota archaeon]
MTEYKIKNIDKTGHAKILKQISTMEYLVNINNNEKIVNILDVSEDYIEFKLDNVYHVARIIERSTSEIKILIDDVSIVLNTNYGLNEIVYKNSGGSITDSQINLISQIPGKVISVKINEKEEIKKGDIVCVLESMKMQVTVKSHKDGLVKKINAKTGSTVAKNDIIAEIE